MRRAQAFVRLALDAIPRTAGQAASPTPEAELVGSVWVELSKLGRRDPAFRAALVERWARPDIRAVLSARSSLQLGVASYVESTAHHEATRLADVAARRRSCGLPSCGRREVSVRHYRLCGGCDCGLYYRVI